MTNKKQYLLTIIIPTFNEFENVDKIIQKLKKVLYKRISYKIIFVDDNSNDGTSDKIKQYQKEKYRAKKEQALVRLLRKEVEIGGGGTQEYVIKNGVNKGRIAKGFQK